MQYYLIPVLDDDPLWTETYWITQHHNTKHLTMNTCILLVVMIQLSTLHRMNIKPISPFNCGIILQISMDEVTEELSLCFNTMMTPTVTSALNGGQPLSHYSGHTLTKVHTTLLICR
jgi:hypothetical protein